MPTFLESLISSSPAWLVTAWHITWQASLLAAVLVVVCKVWRSAPAPVRYGLLLIALAKFLVPPFFTAPVGVFSRVRVAKQEVTKPAVLTTQLDRSVAGERSEAVPSTAFLDDAARVPPSLSLSPASLSPASGPAAIEAEVATAGSSLGRWIAGLWLAGVGIALLRALRSLQCLHRTRRGAAAASAELQEEWAALVGRLGLRAAPELLITNQPVGPLAIGVLRPAVILPRTMLALPTEELQPVLAHELIHHRRRDLLVAWLQSVVSIVWWCNPIVAVLNRSVRQVREECCDDALLVTDIADRDIYCQSLLDAARLAGSHRAHSLSVAYSEHPMGPRFRRIMDGTRSLRTRLGWSGYGAVAALACVALPGLDGRGSGAQATQAMVVSSQDPAEQRQLRGTVVDASGKPVAAAEVYISSDQAGRAARASTGSDGTFAFGVAADKITKKTAVLVAKPGYGVQWAKVEIDDTLAVKPLAVELIADHPIRGQLLDTEGSPLVGATIETFRIYAGSDASLDPMMDKIADGTAIKSFPMWNTLRRRYSGAGLPQTLTTDANGDFVALGFGGERAVIFVVRAEGCATAPMTVLTRPMDAFTYPAGGKKGILGARTFYGSTFVHIASPGRTVVGRALNASGEPVAGADVRVEIPTGTDASGSRYSAVDNYQGDAESVTCPTYMGTKTGVDGRFVMRGLPRTRFSTMTVDGHDLGYLYDSHRIPDADADDAVELEFSLKRCCTIRGQVADADGKPVTGAKVLFVDDMRSAEFRRGDPDGVTSEHHRTETDADGLYRLQVPPGDARLITVHAGAKFAGSRMPKGRMLAYFGMGKLNAVHQFDAVADAVVEANFVIKMADVSRVVVVGPDDKPLDGCRVVGLGAHEIWYEQGKQPHDTHEFELLGFDPAAPRNVAAYHEGKHLIGMLDKAVLKGPQPWVLKLQPAARITGQLVDIDGAPRAGIQIYVKSDLPNDAGSMGFVAGQMEMLSGTKATDAEGRFELAALVPGATYSVHTLDDQIRDRRRLKQGIKVSAGQTVNIGSLVGELN